MIITPDAFSRIDKLLLDRDVLDPVESRRRRAELGFSIVVGNDVARSYDLQLALLTAVNLGARCFAGNFLFSTGPNSQGGGKRTTKGHYDVPMRDCTVSLDSDVIIERGRIVDDRMRVARVAR